MIETERLELHLLNEEQLRLWIEDISALEKELNCSYQGESLEGHFLEVVKYQYEAARREPENFCWHSFWFLIRKTDRVVVGSSSFHGVPDEKQEVEIGYGLGEKHRHHGYMTEAVKALCDWAKKQKNVSHVIAETDLDGFASQKILKTCGFTETSRGDSVWWRL
jgi:ribosomal-protein-alanine N-acetyltransferase